MNAGPVHQPGTFNIEAYSGGRWHGGMNRLTREAAIAAARTWAAQDGSRHRVFDLDGKVIFDTDAAPVDVLAVIPVMDHPLSPTDGDGPLDAMTDWIAGDVKPHHEGPYLRQFDEGDALSWWNDGCWNADSFFAGPSDIQDARWRGFDRGALARVGSSS